jgi:hypothetical protein
MTIPTEPLFIGSRYVQVKFYAAPRNPGDPSTIVGTLTLMPDENVLVLDALKGDKGERGEPAPFWRPEWQSTIVDPADLDDLELGDDDAGRAWYISGYWHVWTGDEFIPFLGAIPGPPGVTPVITMHVQQIEMPESGPYGEVDVEPSGTPEEPHYTIMLPGIPGPPGENARILEAEDYFGATPLEGQTLLYSADAGGEGVPGFAPGDPSPWAVQWITFPESSFGPGGTYSQARTVVLSGLVAASNIAYYPKVDGHLRWKRSGLFNSAQVEVEVRWLEEGSNDSPETGNLIGRALYDPSTLDAETISHIRAHFSDNSDPSRAVSPDTNVGRIPVDTAIRVYVILYRSGGSGNYVYATPGSHLSFEKLPVS